MKVWSKDSEKFLIENVQSMGIPYVAAKLNKTIMSVKQKMSRYKISIKKKSPYKGIFWNNRDNNWIIYVIFNNEVMKLGEYDTIDEARMQLFAHNSLEKV